MSLFNVFKISGSAVAAESQRLNLVASNLANAETVKGPDGSPYKAKQAVFQSMDLDASGNATGVRVKEIAESNAPVRSEHRPGDPNADENGDVTMNNVNPVDEMVDMISSSRSYQSNVDVMTTAKSMLEKTLQMGS